MTTKRGVIAALACLFATLPKRLPAQDDAIKIEASAPAALFSLNLQCGHGPRSSACVLEVRCRDRVVRLTADEIMDALEKPIGLFAQAIIYGTRWQRLANDAVATVKEQQVEIVALQKSLDSLLTTCSAEQWRFESHLAELGEYDQ